MSEFSGKSSSQIARELDERRERLRGKIDDLSQQIRPEQLWKSAQAALTGSGGGEFAGNLGRSLRDNPLPVALVGAGIAWMIAGQSGKDKSREPAAASRFAGRPANIDPDTGPLSYGSGELRNGMSRDSEQQNATGDDNRFGDRVSQAGERVEQSLAKTRHGVQEGLSTVSDAAREQFSDAQAQSRQAVSDMSEKLRDGFRANPVVFALGTATAAAVVGALLPRTRREDEVLGSYADQAREDVREASKSALDKASDIAEKTVETVRDEAQKRGYDADKVESVVSEAIDDARDIAKESAKTIEKKSKASAKNDDEAESGMKPSGSEHRST